MSRVAYDAMADIYDAWCDSAPVTRANHLFYVNRLFQPEGVSVELGVGNGRICIEVAKKGKAIVGVDSSPAMLELCRDRARRAGVADRLTLIEGDFRDFELPEAAELITIPFHSIGHLLTREDKQTALRRIHRQLVPGGKLIFDHFVFDPDYPLVPGVPRLRAEYRDSETGRDRLLWEAVTRDEHQQLLRIIVWTDDIDKMGVVMSRRYRRMNLSWLTPEQSQSLLEDSGFEVETVFGDFDESPLSATSPQQIWVGVKAS